MVSAHKAADLTGPSLPRTEFISLQDVSMGSGPRDSYLPAASMKHREISLRQENKREIWLEMLVGRGLQETHCGYFLCPFLFAIFQVEKCYPRVRTRRLKQKTHRRVGRTCNIHMFMIRVRKVYVLYYYSIDTVSKSLLLVGCCSWKYNLRSEMVNDISVDYDWSMIESILYNISFLLFALFINWMKIHGGRMINGTN